MILNVLSVIFTLSMVYVLINMLNIYIPKISEYYKQYTYQAYIKDFILVISTTLIAIFLFNILNLGNIMLFVGLLVLITSVSNIAINKLFQVLSFNGIVDNDFMKSSVKLGIEQGLNITLKDLFVIVNAFLFTMIFKLLGLNIALGLTISAVGLAMYNLLYESN